MHKSMLRLTAFLALAVLTLGGWAASSYASQISPAPRTVNVLVGWGKDTDQVTRFFPGNFTVRVGDTVTWKTTTDEIHTVSFLGQGALKNAIPGSLIQNAAENPGEMMPGFVAPLPNAKSPMDVMGNPMVFFPTRQQGASVEHYSGQGYVNSGVMSETAPSFLPAGTPANNTFSLTFDKPGTYTYYCLVHPYMRGTVNVVSADAASVPSQNELDAQAQKEIAAAQGLLKGIRTQSDQVVKQDGPNGTSLYYVRAGASDIASGDLTIQAFDFFPKTATIKAGDTVIWSSNYFHTVTFSPSTGPAPDIAVVQPQPNGPPLITLNLAVFAPARPSATYDPTKTYNSGIIGLLGDSGKSWSLTFDKPGTYTYYCAVHDELGMKATIVVQPK
jgi:plastocyanin